jgi:hypothetical protein
MKIIVIIILLVKTLLAVYSQDAKYYYFYTDAQIEENIKLNLHKSCQVLKIENTDFFLGTVIEFGGSGIVPTVLNCISVGKVNQINNVLYCIDKKLNRTYIFKQLDFYTIEALNNTAIFVKGTKLYLHLGSVSGKAYRAFLQADDLIKSDYWKTGIRNGIQIYYDDNFSEKLIYYRDNISIDSIALSYSDSAFKEKRLNFINQHLGDTTKCYY